jgi:hypothetical protein
MMGTGTAPTIAVGALSLWLIVLVKATIILLLAWISTVFLKRRSAAVCGCSFSPIGQTSRSRAFRPGNGCMGFGRDQSIKIPALAESVETQMKAELPKIVNARWN